MPIRKSRYYQSAIDYYRGHLADMRFERNTAVGYYEKIPNEQQERYWYLNAQMHLRFPMDSLQYRFFVADNYFNSRQFSRSRTVAEQLKRDLDRGEGSSNPFLPQLVDNLLARQYRYYRKMDRAAECFERVYKNLHKVDDDYQRSWLLIHYGRFLRDMNQFDRALEMFKQAEKLDEDFTKIICEREKFVTQRQKDNQLKDEPDDE